MDVKELRRLLRLMRDFELTELEIEEEGSRVRVRRGAEGGTNVPVYAAAPGPAIEPVTEDLTDEQDARLEGLVEITSPMVGTFYRAPAPEAPPYVEVGSTVSVGQTLCILEAMKLMNELECEIDGVVREILVENGDPVEYGQVLFRVEQA